MVLVPALYPQLLTRCRGHHNHFRRQPTRPNTHLTIQNMGITPLLHRDQTPTFYLRHARRMPDTLGHPNLLLH
jgi:hypothetical protein